MVGRVSGAGRRLRADHRRLRHLRRRGDVARRAAAGRAARCRGRVAPRDRRSDHEPRGGADRRLSRIKLSCNWMAAAGHPGEDARLYAGVRAASETAVALGIAIPVGKDSMSMRTQWERQERVRARRSRSSSPRSVRSPTCAARSRPSCAAAAASCCSSISAAGRTGSAAAASRRCYGQLGDAPPDLDDPRRLRAFFARDAAARRRRQAARVSRSLRRRRDRQRARDGVRRRARPRARHHRASTPIRSRALFAEELGAILEVARARRRARARRARRAGFAVHAIGRAVAGDRITVAHGGDVVIDATRSELRARWSHVTHQIARRRDDAGCADEEHATRIDPDAPGLTAELDVRSGRRHRRAVHRQGRAPARRDPARARRQRPDRDGRRVHARRASTRSTST